MRFSFRANGVPKAQPRARATIRGKHAGVYDPGTANGWKVLVAAAGAPHRPPTPLDGGLMVSIDFYLPRPKRLMRKKDSDEVLPHTSKPDVDNLAKAVLDVMTQDGWWRDDSQVFASIVRKWYCRKDGVPGAQITVVS